MDLMRALLVGAVAKLILLMVMLVILANPAIAGEAEFIMSEAHCTLLKQHAIKAITAKTAGVEYPQYVRERIAEGRTLTTLDRVVFDDIIPYSLEMAYEFFNNDFDPATPYEEVIERNCLSNLGSAAK